MTIAIRLVRDRMRGMRWWAGGTVLGVTATVALFPTIKGQAELEDLLRDLPSGIQAMIGSDVAIPITSAAGYLQARLFSTLLPILLIVYAVGVGARAIGGAEEDGTLQLVVTGPVTRRRLAVERLGAAAALVLGLALVSLVTTMALAVPTGVFDEVAPGRVVIATASVTGLALLHLAVAFAAGAVTGRRGPPVTVGSALAVGGYLVHGLAASAEAVRPARVVSPFWWILDRNLLVQDPTLQSLALPMILAVAAAMVGVAAYERRDLRFP